MGDLASAPYGPSFIDPKQSEANVRLIASAPATLIEAADLIDELRAALENARSLLRAFGGDCSGLTEQEAKENNVDMVQWAMLQQINAALSKAGDV